MLFGLIFCLYNLIQFQKHYLTLANFNISKSPNVLKNQRGLLKNFIYELIENDGRFKVLLTREKDVYVKLRDRIEIARSRKADLFISLHADAIKKKKVRGMSVYTLGLKPSS